MGFYVAGLMNNPCFGKEIKCLITVTNSKALSDLVKLCFFHSSKRFDNGDSFIFSDHEIGPSSSVEVIYYCQKIYIP